MLSCDAVRAALSARMDGETPEDPQLSPDVIDAHLANCEECRAWYERALLLNSSLRVEETEVPDLSAQILAGVEPERRRRAVSRALWLGVARAVLVVLGLGFLAWAITILRTSVGQGAAEDPGYGRLLVDAAAMRFALGFGLFFVAWRPRNSGALLPVYGALFAFSFGFATRDVVLGTADLSEGWWLFLMFCSAVTLLVTWLSGFGLAAMERVWRSASAAPEKW